MEQPKASRASDVDEYRRQKQDRVTRAAQADAERKARIAQALKSGVRRQQSRQRRLFK